MKSEAIQRKSWIFFEKKTAPDFLFKKPLSCFKQQGSACDKSHPTDQLTFFAGKLFQQKNVPNLGHVLYRGGLLLHN
jgi:hypothetical protein